jgi:nicotinate-nucleotide adenylyltransferase
MSHGSSGRMAAPGAREGIGVLGGTFDPPHIGHLVVAGEALWQLGLSEVRLVPALRPPHKEGRAIAPAERRAAWLEMAAAPVDGLVVSRVEIERGDALSFTADTLEGMAATARGQPLWFILGADQLQDFQRWHAPERILAVARLAVAAREGGERTELARLAARVAPGRATILDIPRIDVSSSMIRERMAAGLPVAHLLPTAVAAALRREGLVP